MRPLTGLVFVAALLAIGTPAGAEDQTTYDAVLIPAGDCETPLPRPKPRWMHSER
jgi:hypothetical protein